MNFKKVPFVVAPLAAAVFFAVSCTGNIGLGNQVDTEAPKVSVTAPDPGTVSIVRSEFEMSGKYKDDLAVKDIQVVLTDTKDSAKSYSFTAEKNGKTSQEGEWTCVINPLDEDSRILDGTYVAKVVASDEAGHETEATVNFSIDNTPPLVVLKTPSTKSIENPTEFGQLFSVSMSYHDDSEVDSFDFIFYDKDGNELCRENKISGNEIDVAKWGDEVYDVIYGNDKEAGTKAYYLGIVAYDGARLLSSQNGGGATTKETRLKYFI